MHLNVRKKASKKERKTDRQTDRQTDGQTDRDRQTERKRGRKKERKKESVVLSNNALYNAYIFDADYHLFMTSDIKPSSKQKTYWHGLPQIQLIRYQPVS